MVEEHLERRLVKKDAVAQADAAPYVEEAAAEGGRDEGNDQREGRHGGGEREASQRAPREAGPPQPEHRDDEGARRDPEERAARLDDQHQGHVQDREQHDDPHDPHALAREHQHRGARRRHDGEELPIEVRVAERRERTETRIEVDPPDRVVAGGLLNRVEARESGSRSDRPRQPRGAARIVDRNGDGHCDEREDSMRGEPEVTTDLAIERDVLVLRGDGGDDLGRDEGEERDEQGRRGDTDTIAERDDDERAQEGPCNPVREARLGQIEDVEDGRVERQDEDQRLHADDDERELAPEHSAHNGTFASRGAPPGHYNALSKSSLARSKYQKPTTKRTRAMAAEYASASHCGASPSSSAR